MKLNCKMATLCLAIHESITTNLRIFFLLSKDCMKGSFNIFDCNDGNLNIIIIFCCFITDHNIFQLTYTILNVTDLLCNLLSIYSLSYPSFSNSYHHTICCSLSSIITDNTLEDCRLSCKER